VTTIVEHVFERTPATLTFARAVVAEATGNIDAVLATGELVANAVEHGAGDVYTLTISPAADGTAVRVAVTNAISPGAALVPRQPDWHAERGRGLGIVAQLTPRWGVERDGERVTVWFIAGKEIEGSA